MKYQLVLQFPYDGSAAAYDRLMALEDAAIEGIGDKGIIDGHDYGSGEMNLFVHTNDPSEAFSVLKRLFGPNEEAQVRAGYRDFEEDTYTPIFPTSLKHFSVT